MEAKAEIKGAHPSPRVIDLQRRVHAWANDALPGRQVDAAWKKLFEELGEVLRNPRDPGEWGDVFILLMDLATIYGVAVDVAVETKLAINCGRTWELTETGVYQHVESDAG